MSEKQEPDLDPNKAKKRERILVTRTRDGNIITVVDRGDCSRNYTDAEKTLIANRRAMDGVVVIYDSEASESPRDDTSETTDDIDGIADDNQVDHQRRHEVGKHTPSAAKNEIKRSLFEIMSPWPSDSQKNEIWAYFHHTCAYCGRELVRADRNGHLDHVTPQAKGGTNNMHNLILSCNTCNSDEKREQDWDLFLRIKNPNNADYKRRRAVILEWKAMDTEQLDSSIVKLIDDQIELVYKQYDRSVSLIRERKNSK